MTNGEHALIKSLQRFIAIVDKFGPLNIVYLPEFTDLKGKLKLVIKSQPRKKL